jgi:hypothetical protein
MSWMPGTGQHRAGHDGPSAATVAPSTSFAKQIFKQPRRHAPSSSRHTIARAMHRWCPSNEVQRAQGKPDAQCTRGLACKQWKAHELVTTGSPEAARPSLRNGFNGFLCALPGDQTLLSPSPRIIERDLTPALGRQDHTALPSADHADHRRAREARVAQQRPPHPAPRFVTIGRDAPLPGRDAREHACESGWMSREFLENGIVQ